MTLVSTAMLAIGASGASAATYYVNGAGSDANSCVEPAAPCQHIGAAIARAQSAPEASTILVAPGIYQEAPGAMEIEEAGDEGLAIVGSGSGAGGTAIVGHAKASEPVISLGLTGGTVRLAHLAVIAPAEDVEPGIETKENTILEDVSVAIQSAGGGAGVDVESPGALTWTGGGVLMEAATKGGAIRSDVAPVSLNGVAVTIAAGSESSGISNGLAPLTIQNSSVTVAGPPGGTAINDFMGPLALSNVTVNQSANHDGIVAQQPASATYAGVAVHMLDEKGSEPALIQIRNAATIQGLTVDGSWMGTGVVLEGPSFALLDSHVTLPAASTSEALFYRGRNEGPGLLVQRSSLQGPQTDPETVVVSEGNATFDSSAVLGGKTALVFANGNPRPKEITVAASTIDAGVVGAADEKDHSISVNSELGAAASVTAVGSILVEPQRAEHERASVACVDTDAPNQAQAATVSLGAINCATGLSGNTTTPPSGLFAAPTTSLAPAFGSAAIDSVPAGAISLPFGQTPSPTDLLGSPRVLDGNGDCIAVQDRGAVELTGHAAPCPPVKGSISALKMSPSAFRAAPKGPTVAKARFGTLITYLDSQAATTTFTVLQPQAGRKAHGACRKPSKKNRKGKPCTRLVAVGSFTHHDLIGGNSLRFTGRLHARKLAKGSYRLQAVPHNAAGAGNTVLKTFRIK
jgi:hypothetical protein